MFAFAYSWWFAHFGAMTHGHCCFKALNENTLTMEIWQMLFVCGCFSLSFVCFQLVAVHPPWCYQQYQQTKSHGQGSYGAGNEIQQGFLYCIDAGALNSWLGKNKTETGLLVLTAVVPRERSTSPKFQEMDVKGVKERLLVELAEHCGQWEEEG